MSPASCYAAFACTQTLGVAAGSAEAMHMLKDGTVANSLNAKFSGVAPDDDKGASPWEGLARTIANALGERAGL